PPLFYLPAFILRPLPFSFFSLIIPPPPLSTLFPYTTLFRSAMAAWFSLWVLGLGAGLVVSVAGALVPEVGKIIRMASMPLLIIRSEEHTSELQSRFDLVCRLLLEKKNAYTFSSSPCVLFNYT